ncbi:nucleoside ABC transporter ATP-binding protein [Plasticicumulans lactativorans]|uniref:Nucleoside ABC transporter ATP-binding protein n=1 Tax=Plasticicumulans lactativorans TaxID=1133106 RepID=A0A4R2L2Y2_9GAMM|nr:ABC transporter ATP-binding protein [Plasticicumulans lactativorans]TCO79587.1 nucleoside ABC transporter ATP-binding protein [Plasticicumulans lactativorans]
MAALELEVVDLGKRFGDFVALQGVSTKVAAGSFHALLGENGAGKSTLVKCIVGYQMPDEGAILVDRREREIRHPADADALGLGMVYQHFTLAPGLSVLENLVLARPRLPAVLDWAAERARLEAFLDTAPLHVPLDAPVATLAAGQKQKAEILKQLYLDRRFLILDEPTSVLTPQEADEVLGLLHGLTRAGRLSVLMISHKFREVEAFCDEVTVLRRGRYVGRGGVAELGRERMAALMMGSEALPEPPARAARVPGVTRLRVADLAVHDDKGVAAVAGMGFDVRAGEIVGLAGVSGNGQRELVEALLGQRAVAAGVLEVDGAAYRGSRAEIDRAGLASLPEEPLKNACVPQMSVADNLALRSFDRPPQTRLGWLRRGTIRARGRELIAAFQVRTPGPDAPIAALSGGNVQRAVLARELAQPRALLIVANPVFGLDFASAAAIHQRLMAARNAGAAVLLVSEDLDEILALADRVLVISGGRIVHETTPAAADRHTLGRHMAAH